MRQYLFYNRTLHFIITFGIHSLSNNEETSMGKNGKARKRQKIEQEIRKYGELANESDDSNAEEEDGPQLAGLSPLEVEALLQVLKSFSRRLDLYEDKACKPLRIAIFPLIEIQQSKFFEDVAKPVPLTDEEFHASLSASLVAKASNAISYLIRNTEEFASEQYKHIRRALHPLVVHTNRKLKAGKATAQLSASVRSATTTAGSAALSSLSEDLATTNGQSNSSSSSSSSSLSNRISNCFRSGDHVGAQRALEALHRLCTSATTSETERSAALPKLGSLQRWVRDCDIAALRQAIAANNIDCKVSSTSNSFSSSDSDGAVGAAAVDVEEGLKETALLLLHSVLRVTCLLKLRAVPVAAPGAPAAAVFSPAPVTVSGAAVGSLAAMRASLLHKRPLASSGRKQTPAAVFSSSTSVPQLPLFRSAVKVEYPAFSVPPVYPKEAYFTSSSMTALIAKAAADSPLCTEITLRSKAAAPATAAPATSISVLSPTLSSCTCLLPPATAFPSLVRVVSHVPGPQRRPPTAHDLNIFLTAPGTIRYFHSQEEISTYCSSGCCAVHDGISGGVLGAESAEKAPGGETTATATREKEVFSLPVPVLPSPVRHDVPSVPGAMLLTGVLTPLECAQFIVAAERLGYTPDAVDGIDNVVWLADPALLGPLYQRVQSLLPQTLEGHALTGINARLRLFRYYPGAVYRPHIDGAWPGSGLNAEGIYTDDAFDGQQHSRLTFLVYLNDGFEGGTTTYFLPGDEAEVKAEAESVCGAHNSSSAGDNGDGDIQTAMEGSSGAKESASGKVGRIEVRRVKPQLGSVLVFPHGSASGSLVHEGSAVLSGVKYVIRTDVLYTSSAISSTC